MICAFNRICKSVFDQMDAFSYRRESSSSVNCHFDTTVVFEFRGKSNVMKVIVVRGLKSLEFKTEFKFRIT